jgi:mannose-6-phosphate isomerase-like protein (cupin superfamily)
LASRERLVIRAHHRVAEYGHLARRGIEHEGSTRGRMDAMEHFTVATVAEQSAAFRRVLWTGAHTQLVIMTIPVGGEIGQETHENTDQILTFVSGTGEAVVAGQARQVAQGDLVVVPAGTEHNFRNTGVNPLVLYTVYAPPEHADGTVHATKEEAEAAERAGQDQPPNT